MKKKYQSPQIAFESFRMSANIATCSIETTIGQYQCPVVDPESGFSIFTDDAICEVTGGEGNICYNVSMEDTTVFSS